MFTEVKEENNKNNKMKKQYNKDKMVKATVLFLEAIGQKLSDPNIIETPRRVSDMWEILLGGYEIKPEST